MTPSTWRKLILAGVIAVLAAWAAIPLVLRRAGPVAAQAAGAKPGLGPAVGVDDDMNNAVASVLAAVAALPEPETSADVGWPADPFGTRDAGRGTRDPNLEPAAPSPELTLDGVISGDSPRALVAGQIVAVGDQLPGGYTVMAIDTNSVTLAGPQGPWTLTLPQ